VHDGDDENFSLVFAGMGCNNVSLHPCHTHWSYLGLSWRLRAPTGGEGIPEMRCQG
jgi:hypothetical protein